MKARLEKLIQRFDDLENQLADPQVITEKERLKELAQERGRLEPIVTTARRYLLISDQIEEDRNILAGEDQDLKTIAQEELEELESTQRKLEQELQLRLIPRDPNDDRNTIVEIRAGTGGDEAALFVADLFRMYSRFAERNGWVQKVITSHEIGIGGLKEIIFTLDGEGAFGRMKYESGVHRVQRVPKTETGGRIHTSAATVAVLPEARDAEVEIVESDLKIDTYRSSGAGGQHVNKTESAIRITHLPTGLVVTCQDEKSQHKNKNAALKVLRSRLLAREQERLERERARARRSMVSSGDRSAKIRTYNFPQGRITDHRVNHTTHRLEEILDGDLAEFIEELTRADQEARLSAL